MTKRMTNSADDTELMMRLYSRHNSSNDTYDLCDLRETLVKELSSSNLYRITLNCVEVDEDKLKASDVDL